MGRQGSASLSMHRSWLPFSTVRSRSRSGWRTTTTRSQPISISSARAAPRSTTPSGGGKLPQMVMSNLVYVMPLGDRRSWSSRRSPWPAKATVPGTTMRWSSIELPGACAPSSTASWFTWLLHPMTCSSRTPRPFGSEIRAWWIRLRPGLAGSVGSTMSSCSIPLCRLRISGRSSSTRASHRPFQNSWARRYRHCFAVKSR